VPVTFELQDGATTIATAVIPAGRTWAESLITRGIPRGAYLSVYTTGNGGYSPALGLSISVAGNLCA
jgi:hypothetical protein